MKWNRKTFQSFALLVFLGMLVGTLGWEVFERVLSLFDVSISLSVGPIGFDADVLSVWMKANPGMFLGVPAGILLARSL